MGPGPDRRDRRTGLEWETNGRVRPVMGLDFPMPEHRRRIYRKRIFRKRIYRKRIYRKRKTAHN